MKARALCQPATRVSRRGPHLAPPGVPLRGKPRHWAAAARLGVGGTYARRGEHRVVVPSKGIFKYAVKLPPAAQAACAAQVVDTPTLARMARECAGAIMADAQRRLQADHAMPAATAQQAARRAACGPPKVRLVSCHN